MRNFFKLAEGVNVVELTTALARQPELWDIEGQRLRTTHPGTPHTQVSDIWLRFNDMALIQANPEAVLDEHESVNYKAMALLPSVRPIIFNLMRLVEGERLGRVLITRMAPGTCIAPHVDGGSHAAYYDRYHVALSSLPGCQFRAGREIVNMATGDVWWFDNSIEHEVKNNSADDRIVMIVDIKTLSGGFAGA